MQMVRQLELFPEMQIADLSKPLLPKNKSNNESIVPVNIRPHLVAFLFDHFKGKEAEYLGKKVKSIQIQTKSSVGRYIRTLCQKADKPCDASKCNMFLSVKSVENSKIFKGTIFKFSSGQYSFLRIPPELNEDLNNLFQDLFETSFYFYVEGYRQKNYHGAMRDGIRDFIDKYNLFEYGYSYGALEQVYLRTRRERTTLSRFHRKPN